MNTAPIEPAALSFNADGLPFSARYRDIYHPRAGAFTQARHVFVAGNGLPARWQGRERFVALETGFGLGNNFLATWQAWRDDPQRCARLVFVSVEAHPLTRDELATAHAGSALPELADALQRAWPPLTPNLHTLDFDGGRVQLLLALGDVQAWLPELVMAADAFYLDGFAPATNPRMWDQRVCKALSRLAAPGATLATWSAAQALREHLTTAGFEVRLAQGTGGKRDITLARFAPAFTPRRAPARAPARERVEPQALIIGGGLAGCAAAWALAEQGWRSTLLERHPQIASEASGNPAGLFHGIVNAQDGVHARFNRAAALMARQSVRVALHEHGVAGAVDGLLRLEADTSPAAMQAMLHALGLPADYVQAVAAEHASALSGLDLHHAAWFYPGGGWVQPAGLARAWLERAAPHVEIRCGADVQTLQRSAAGWRLCDATGATLGEAATVVLANAGDASRLLGMPGWPVDKIRGQISLLPAGALALPRIPVAGAGYLLPALGDDGDAAMFGATAQRGDDDAFVREADHRANLAQLAQLIGHHVDADPATMRGRTAWRWSAIDRLPLIGAVPDADAHASRLDQPRFVPRVPGLFVFTALGSRGITWSALGARLLAALITGAPAPLEASLIDAVDPARFVSRRARRATRAP
jgi:tRNA 5-methylaminomethyl-2-thiouridine biosynthesis bifunctional protein